MIEHRCSCRKGNKATQEEWDKSEGKRERKPPTNVSVRAWEFGLTGISRIFSYLYTPVHEYYIILSSIPSAMGRNEPTMGDVHNSLNNLDYIYKPAKLDITMNLPVSI